MKFPEKLDGFPGPSWIFSGPYRGTACKLYVDGEKFHKYDMPKRSKVKTTWVVGDRMGILVRYDGHISLYLNREHIQTVQAPGLSDIQEVDFYLVVESFGFVTSLSLVSGATPVELLRPMAAVDPALKKKSIASPGGFFNAMKKSSTGSATDA